MNDVKNSLVQLLGGNLEEVVLSKGVLSVTSIELEDVLDSVVALHVQGKRLGAQVPGNTLRARRSGKRAVVVVDTVGVEMGSQGREIKGAGLGVSARSGNVVDVSEDRVEERSGVTELGKLKDESNDSSITS